MKDFESLTVISVEYYCNILHFQSNLSNTDYYYMIASPVPHHLISTRHVPISLKLCPCPKLLFLERVAVIRFEMSVYFQKYITFIDPLLHIINLSMTLGYVPKTFKLAVIKPLIKKHNVILKD